MGTSWLQKGATQREAAAFHGSLRKARGWSHGFVFHEGWGEECRRRGNGPEMKSPRGQRKMSLFRIFPQERRRNPSKATPPCPEARLGRTVTPSLPPPERPRGAPGAGSGGGGAGPSRAAPPGLTALPAGERDVRPGWAGPASAFLSPSLRLLSPAPLQRRARSLREGWWAGPRAGAGPGLSGLREGPRWPHPRPRCGPGQGRAGRGRWDGSLRGDPRVAASVLAPKGHPASRCWPSLGRRGWADAVREHHLSGRAERRVGGPRSAGPGVTVVMGTAFREGVFSPPFQRRVIWLLGGNLHSAAAKCYCDEIPAQRKVGET